MATRVEIVAYDPNWPQRYQEIAQDLRRILDALVIAVDHIGSTAVPGMAAKAVIDIDVTLRGLPDIAAASALLVAAGYQARGNRYDDDVWAFMLQGVEPNRRVYLCPADNETHRRRLVFRDHLRSHADTALAYAALKARLAEAYRYDGDRYTAEKTRFINAIVDREDRMTGDRSAMVQATVTCEIRYRLKPGSLAEFEAYAQTWMTLIERYGGTHHGYFVPREKPEGVGASFPGVGEDGAGDIAVALFTFADEAAYLRYRSDVAADPDGMAANALYADDPPFVSYERVFLQPLARRR